MKALNFIPSHEIRPITIEQLSNFNNKKFKSCYKFKKIISIYKNAQLSCSVKNRKEFCDYDYLDKLNSKELKWIKSFNKEWLNADFKHDGRKFHKTAKQRKRCTDMNNARNRDLYALFRQNQLIYLGTKGYP